VADADGSRLEGHRLPVAGDAELPRPWAYRHQWPPRLGDEDGWRRWTGAQPCFRRGDARFTHGMDRCRVLGNGVVPQQAERAFRSLYERLIGGSLG
jgi:DNA (cytosine-5)-methyltransferase 1